MLIELKRSKFSADDIVVNIKGRSFEGCADAATHCYQNQPEGYSLISSRISRRGSRGGRRHQLQLVLRHTDPSIPSIVQSEVEEYDLFKKEVELAGSKP